MTVLDPAGFVACAREQIRAADVILAGHYEQIPMCSCGRTLPCSQALTLRWRQQHFINQLVMLDAPTITATASVGGALVGEIVTP